MANARTVSPLEPDDPSRLGSWRLVGRLGAGGMGIVYLGESRGGQRVAVKLLRADLARSVRYRERFRREAHAAARAGGLCTARVLEVGGDDTAPYLVTEYVDGPTLTAAVAADGPFNGERLRSFAAGVAEALAAIHAAGVVHRDLTPGNVLLGPAGPKVIDFGIARADDAETITMTGLRMGTPGWMAPEQVRGERAGPEADVFGWGTLVAFAGTGRPPFGEGRPDAVLYRIVHEDPDLTGLDPDLVPLVRRALAKDGTERPRPSELLESLAGPDVVTDPGTLRALLDRTWVMPAVPPGGPPPGAPDPPPRRRRAWLAVLVAGVATVAVALGALGLVALTDDDDPNAEAPASTVATTTTTTEPPPARDLEAYCVLVEDYYVQLDDFEQQFGEVDEDDEVEREQLAIAFYQDTSPLLDEMSAVAPEDIAPDVETIAAAYRRAAVGDLDAVTEEPVAAATERTVDYEESECGIERDNGDDGGGNPILDFLEDLFGLPL